MGKGHIKSPGDELSFSLGELSREVDIALQLWGKRAYPDYTVFQPVVDLGLGIVETEAEQLIEAEIDLTGYQRAVTDGDRQRAVWKLLKTAIGALRPPALELPHAVSEALDRLPLVGWPENLHVPQECFDFLVLSFAYMWKSKSNKQIARFLGVSERTLAHIRSKAVARVATRFYQWELNCTMLQFVAG